MCGKVYSFYFNLQYWEFSVSLIITSRISIRAIVGNLNFFSLSSSLHNNIKITIYNVKKWEREERTKKRLDGWDVSWRFIFIISLSPFTSFIFLCFLSYSFQGLALYFKSTFKILSFSTHANVIEAFLIFHFAKPYKHVLCNVCHSVIFLNLLA